MLVLAFLIGVGYEITWPTASLTVAARN